MRANAIWLAQRGWSATALDFAEAGLDKGRTLERSIAGTGTPPVTWVCADVTTYVPPVVGFDLVLLAHLHRPARPALLSVTPPPGSLPKAPC